MTGKIDSSGLGTWQVIRPVATTNLVANPSFEVDTTGWTTSSATLTRTAGAGVFGSYGGRMLASATNGLVSYSPSSIANGTLIVASAWVKASSPLVYLQVFDGVVYTAIQTHPGDGAWHRLEVATVMAATAAPALRIVDGRSSALANIDIDGAQFETGVSAASTYLDGDQDGCIWNGAPHLSTSTRDGRDPRGGALVSLTSLGWSERTWGGIGAPDVETISQDLALTDGQLYQNQRAKPRVITLSVLAQVANLAALHAARRSLLDAFNPNSRTSRGPVRLRYAGAATPKTIDVVNESGFGFEKPYHQRAEMAELRFLAPDPMWRGETDASVGVTVFVSPNPVSGLALRLADGTWSTLGGGIAAATPGHWMYGAVRLLDGRLVVGGTNHLDFGGTAANDNLAVWDGSSWATLGGTAPDGNITALALGNDGKLYAAGEFTHIGGVAINRIAQWSPVTNTWTTVGTGGASSAFTALVIDPATGYLWGIGTLAVPATAGGVTINGCGYWNGSAWVAANTGLPGAGSWQANTSQSIEVGPDGRIYAAIFGAAGTTKGVYVWTGSTWTAYSALAATGGFYALLAANGQLYVAGEFTSLNGITVSNIAALSGAGVNPMAGGVVGTGNYPVYSLAATAGGFVHAAGSHWTTIGGITPPDSIATWNGSSWQPFGADPPDTGTHANDIYIVRTLRDGSLIVGWFAGSGTFGTTMAAEAVTTVTNSGTANAYPVLDFPGAAIVYTLTNLTTGQQISFSGATIASGETARLDLRPGRKTFTTVLRNLLSTVLPGSDLASFCLAPGDNRIALYTTGATATMFWRPREWTVD